MYLCVYVSGCMCACVWGGEESFDLGGQGELTFIIFIKTEFEEQCSGKLLP